ncbi:MAG: universal stress protein [Deltaproteobacteria bacterium]|nr:universal stress protein [Deltaproteobacteria bacterium]
MYKKVLVAVNEHINSEVTGRCALHFSKACRAKFYICFIAEKDTAEESINRAQEAMGRLFVEAENLDVPVESLARAGETVREIDALVRQEGIDIVFAATRREDLVRRSYSGTVFRRLSLKLPCSVALMRVVHFGRIYPRKILVPLKATIDHIAERARFAGFLAKAFGSKVFVFHTPQPVEKFLHGEIHLTPPEWEERISPDISRFLDYLKQQDVEHEGRLLPGRASRNITIEAFAKRHDLIIMGASERSFWASLFQGNPVEEVLREAPCNLIILKPRHED